jgi:hypothetical protein
MEYVTTLQSALAAKTQIELESWVHAYLQTDGNNQAFSDGLKLVERQYHGPIHLDLNRIQRCCGPEEGMKYPVPKDGFELRVSNIQKAYRTGFDLPPLIVNFSNGEFTLNDGNHRYEALVREKVQRFPVIFWTTGEDDAKELVSLLKAWPTKLP